jgi:hypothetical protein
MSKLTGLTRYRLGWRGKMILQVSYWYREFTPGRAPWVDGYATAWRDATFQDVMDLEHRNVSATEPKVEGPRLPPTRRAPPPMPAVKPALDSTDWNVAQAAVQSEPAHEPGHIEYRFLGITGMEDE